MSICFIKREECSHVCAYWSFYFTLQLWKSFGFIYHMFHQISNKVLHSIILMLSGRLEVKLNSFMSPNASLLCHLIFAFSPTFPSTSQALKAHELILNFKLRWWNMFQIVFRGFSEIDFHFIMNTKFDSVKIFRSKSKSFEDKVWLDNFVQFSST